MTLKKGNVNSIQEGQSTQLSIFVLYHRLPQIVRTQTYRTELCILWYQGYRRDMELTCDFCKFSGVNRFLRSYVEPWMYAGHSVTHVPHVCACCALIDLPNIITELYTNFSGICFIQLCQYLVGQNAMYWRFQPLNIDL